MSSIKKTYKPLAWKKSQADKYRKWLLLVVGVVFPISFISRHRLAKHGDLAISLFTQNDILSPRQKCLDALPQWIQDRSPQKFKLDVIEGSQGLTDKVTGIEHGTGTEYHHRFHHFYHRYLSEIARRVCDEDKTNDIRIFEVGLGCMEGGGMINGSPGGSALAWRHLFPHPQFNLDLHILEFDEECGKEWGDAHKEIATVHTGDASDETVLKRVMADSGGKQFDMIVDDGSHLNVHQIATLKYMIANVAPGGIYVVEDTHSACYGWSANTGTKDAGLDVEGTKDCLTTKTGGKTILAYLLDGMKKLTRNREPFPDVNHIDIGMSGAVLQKEIV